MRQQSDVLDTRSLTFLTAESPLDGLEQVFAAQSFGTVTMPSGRELSYNVKPNDVTIRDNADGTRFIAGYLPRSFGGVMMKASIRVKDSDGRRNTDLHAGLLLRRALEHFDATNDRPVSEFGALWVSNQEPGWHSDNYTAYRTALGAEAKPTRQAQARAARATWTGRQMEDMGFDLITSIKTDKAGNVRVIFGRSSVLQGVNAWVSHLRGRRYQD